jgi:hypothetical protein
MKIPTSVQAAFIIGYAAGVPKKTLSRKALNLLRVHLRTAHEILDGGAFNPLSVWDIEKYFKDLAFRLNKKVRNKRHGQIQ